MITKIILTFIGIISMLYADYVFCYVGFSWANETLWYLGLLITITYISSIIFHSHKN